MTRIALFLALGLCAAGPAFGQNSGKLPLVGVLRINTLDTVEPTATGFKDALAALGLVDGRNIRLEVRLAEGHAERLPDLAQSLVQAKASVIVVFGAPAIRAVQQATSTIPIVATTNDLVASGLIASLAKPGGNITGISLLVPELDAKRLEVLAEIVPSGRHFGVLNDPAASGPAGLQVLAVTARARGVELLSVDVHAPQELASALASLRAGGAEGVNILSSPLFNGHRDQIGPLLLQHKLPAICEWREMTASGCLASYGTTLRELYAMQAALIDKMLKGRGSAIRRPSSRRSSSWSSTSRWRAISGSRSRPLSSLAPTRSSNETPRIAGAAGQCCDRPAGATRAAEADVGDRVSQRYVA
jgi:putative ABC transport system substrate-binding protein